MGCHQSLLQYAQLSGYILAPRDVMRIRRDIQQGAGGLYLPTWGPTNLSCLDLTHRTMSLPNCQLWGLGVRTHFILNLYTPRLGGFGYWLYSHCPCYRVLLLESLGVGGVVLHHHYHLLAALPQFSICILHGKARWQGAILGMQSLHHYVKMFSQVCLTHLMGITWEEKGSNVSTFCVYIKGLSWSVSYPPPGHFPLLLVSFS